MKKSANNQTHIRFTDHEYQQLSHDAAAYKESIPGLMKAVYFEKILPRPVMAPDDAKGIMAALNRIGNNVNQIAKHLNSGIREGFTPTLDEIADSIRSLRTFVLETYGSRQN